MMVPVVQTAVIPKSAEPVVINSLDPQARRFAENSQESNVQYVPSNNPLDQKWVIYDHPIAQPSNLEAVAGLGVQDGLIASIYFDLDKSEIKNPRELKELAAQLNRIEGAITVFGFNDPTGPESINQSLDKARATATVEALIGYGIAANRIRAADGGTSRLYADNARNRRASIFLNIPKKFTQNGT
jgi:outer membrane protein OmpA-like peptidoglycan-associated protein